MTSSDLWDFLPSIINFILGGGIALIATLAATRRKANAEADSAAVAARAEEFHLLREQIDLNQQQNMQLIQMLNDRDTDHARQMAEKETRFNEQTDRLREVQRDLVKANQRELSLTNTLNESLRQRDYWKLWHCRTSNCPHRIPPSDILPTLTFDPVAAGIEI